ncbi:Fic family protein [Bacilli bacterium PM5-3]|nr:Fic family protein [Bacilli bacterium PM5-3]MDH6604068.1 Fic family protein [Bacilli bacterium PM5-9]
MRKLPYEIDLNKVNILLHLSEANNKIGELNGVLKLLPNPKILLNAVILGEAKASSEIENIFTTYDELYKEMTSEYDNQSAKEVLRYREAINYASEIVKKREMITTNDIVSIQKIIEPNKGGIRKLPGTVIKNMKTLEVVHTPPQSSLEIIEYLDNLEKYINDLNTTYDPLINMALIHYQFEMIHPFYDGNGRTGRILNVIYLLLKNKLELPIIYLSKYINENKQEYYKLFSETQQDIENIEEFIVFMMNAIKETSVFTINLINEINSEMEKSENLIKEKLPKIYSQELVEAIYFEFYTKNEYFRNYLKISRNTATSYLKQLVENGFLIQEQVGKEIIYKNPKMFDLIDKW